MTPQQQMTSRIDNRGNQITIGDLVVYNRSGYLAHGQISRIRPNKGKGWWEHWYFIVNSEDGETSKVKDPRSIMVIYESAGHAKVSR